MLLLVSYKEALYNKKMNQQKK